MSRRTLTSHKKTPKTKSQVQSAMASGFKASRHETGLGEGAKNNNIGAALTPSDLPNERHHHATDGLIDPFGPVHSDYRGDRNLVLCLHFYFHPVLPLRVSYSP